MYRKVYDYKNKQERATEPLGRWPDYDTVFL